MDHFYKSVYFISRNPFQYTTHFIVPVTIPGYKSKIELLSNVHCVGEMMLRNDNSYLSNELRNEFEF